MNVRELLAQKDAFIGKEVTVEGLLVEKAPERHLYLAPDEENCDDVANSMRIDLPISRRELETRLPCWVGTAYAHFDPATVTGVLQLSDDGIFPAVITSLSKFTTVQYDEIIDILSGD